jgi:hypothetical protein
LSSGAIYPVAPRHPGDVRWGPRSPAPTPAGEAATSFTSAGRLLPHATTVFFPAVASPLPPFRVFRGGIHDAARPPCLDPLPDARGRVADLLPWTSRLPPGAGANGLGRCSSCCARPAGGTCPLLCLHLLIPFLWTNREQSCRSSAPPTKLPAPLLLRIKAYP